MQVNPILALLEKAISEQKLEVEIRGPRLGADEPVPAQFILYHIVGTTKQRITSIPSEPYNPLLETLK